MTASLQLASPHIDHRAPIQTQSDADMEVESNIDRNMTKPQHDAALLDRCSSEQLPVTSNQQSRRFTDNQTSDECYIQPHLQNSSDALDKSGYCKFSIPCYSTIYSIPSSIPSFSTCFVVCVLMGGRG